VGEGQIFFNRRKQRSDDDPARDVEKKDGGQEKDRSDLGTKARARFGRYCHGIAQVESSFGFCGHLPDERTKDKPPFIDPSTRPFDLLRAMRRAEGLRVNPA
jgi:hypothetical protein